MVALPEMSCEGKAQEGSGRRQEEVTTADTAERGDVSPPSALSDGDARSREGGLDVSNYYSPGRSRRLVIVGTGKTGGKFIGRREPQVGASSCKHGRLHRCSY